MKYAVVAFSLLLAYPVQGQSTITDSDKNQYSTARLGGLTWMTQNLNLRASDSYCFNDDSGRCKLWGRLYSERSAEAACKTLGDGKWRLPTVQDWYSLMGITADWTDGYTRSSTRTHSGQFAAHVDGGSSGFDAVLGGFRYPTGSYASEGQVGIYWTSTPQKRDDGDRYNYTGVFNGLSSRSSGIFYFSTASIGQSWYSVRCVRN